MSDTVNNNGSVNAEESLPGSASTYPQHEDSILSFNQTILKPSKTSFSEEILTSISNTITSIDARDITNCNDPYFPTDADYLHSDTILGNKRLYTSDAVESNATVDISQLVINRSTTDETYVENKQNNKAISEINISTVISTNSSSPEHISSPINLDSNDNQRRFSFSKDGRVNATLTHATSQITHGQLILQTRPEGAPEKSEIEHKKHIKQYSKMVEDAKKKELQDSLDTIQKRAQRETKQQELHIFWTEQVLPNWSKMRKTKKIQDIWWKGIPPKVRSKVWYLCMSDELNITPELYSIFLDHAKKKIEIQDSVSNKVGMIDKNSQKALALTDMVKGREDSVEVIKYDISRTFPNLLIFSSTGPLYQPLHNILGAYVCFRPDIGYVQGMSFIAAILLLNLEEYEAFVCLANFINRPILYTFFRVDNEHMEVYFRAFDILVSELFPKVSTNMKRVGMKSNLYLIDWIFTMFSKPLGMDCVCRIWDLYMRDGDSFLFRAALGLIHVQHEELASLEFIHLGQALSKIPEKYNFPDILFSHIAKINFTQKMYEQVLEAAEKQLSTERKQQQSGKAK